MKETMVQGYSVSADERSGRVGSPHWLVNNCPMSPAECQAEKHSHAISTLAHEYWHEPEDEKLPQRVSRGTDASPKISQSNENVTLMETEIDMTTTADETT